MISALGITTRTVKFHQANLLEKLSVESRHDLSSLLITGWRDSQ